MDMRPSTWYGAFVLAVGALLIFLTAIHPGPGPGSLMHVREAGRRLVRDWRITDLCLFPEARYTRHLSQADLHAAFQDHPGARDHFPAGSMVAPPTAWGGPVPPGLPAGADHATMD
jgi:hypothetical protein